ncbi:ADP-heptose:LPS heptosyltransferase [Neolewinella xylanilytica]|uniref:ADP-heptose:LPS heptosyltransferase n=1 Tax=Neolewinella xylanilytica TaxID=1514080 RepID=A0A2S6I300_9BACT|nr:glycosyltransferase family 9 protein [Neolewinella xylanilytica]PPK85556.1 ADP-heptose:LPS heptosyltransferase [Neolewinella xylanilytica]
MATPKVLIVRFSSIGDIVLTSPVIRCVKQQTGAEVHFLTKRSFAATVRHNPYIDRLWTIDKNIAEIAAELVAGDFTHVIDLHGNLRTLELKQRLNWGQLLAGRRPPRTATFDKVNFRKFLLTRFRIDRMPAAHIVDRYLAAARVLGVTNDGRGLDYFIAPEEAVAPPARNYVAFVIGAAHATKRLEEWQMGDICARIDRPVVLLGGPEEAALGDRIAAKCPNAINACGKYSLNGSADLVRQAAVVVTHDTGLMHVAAAFRRPIVSVWGNTVPELGMYPYLPGEEPAVVAEVRGLPCRPCSKIGYAACPQGHFSCMREQKLEAIVRSVLLAVEA